MISDHKVEKQDFFFYYNLTIRLNNKSIYIPIQKRWTRMEDKNI